MVFLLKNDDSKERYCLLRCKLNGLIIARHGFQLAAVAPWYKTLQGNRKSQRWSDCVWGLHGPSFKLVLYILIHRESQLGLQHSVLC
jgi:hypothetical protein